MRIRTKPYALAAALGLVLALPLALAGCVQSPTEVIPTSVPSSAPVFASDADALAAAKKAYAGYLAASDAIGHDGGANPERIVPWVTHDRVPIEIKQYQSFAKTGDHFQGSSTFSDFRLQQLDQSSGGTVLLSAYACDDVTNSRVIDASGSDITPSNRRDIIPIQIQFRNAHAGSPKLLVEGSTPWSGQDFCAV